MGSTCYEVSMRNTARAQELLALFTSAECAEAIAGDLTEGRGDRGSIWFWRQVLATTVALWGGTFTRAPLASLGLVAAGCWLFASSALVGIAAVSLFPQYIGSAMSWIVLSSFWWGGALCTGASLVAVAQARGMAACVVLAITGEALVMAFGLTLLQPEVLRTSSVVFYSIAAFAAAPLLAGGAIVRLRMISCGNHPLEQQR
jgi:hypothetical protein